MAQISISLAELLDLIVINQIMPTQISNIEPQGDAISFEFKTGLFFPKLVQVFVHILEFEKGILVLELITDWFAEKIMKLLPFRDKEYLEYDYPKVIIDLQSLLNKHIAGIQIERVDFKNGRFNIFTKNFPQLI